MQFFPNYLITLTCHLAIIPIDAVISVIDAELMRQRATATGTAGRMARINAELAKKRIEEAKKLPLVTEKKN